MTGLPTRSDPVFVWFTGGTPSAPGHFPESLLAFDRIDLDRFDFDAEFLEPSNRFFDLFAFAIEFDADYADFIIHARLADICDDWKFMTQLMQHGPRDELLRIH